MASPVKLGPCLGPAKGPVRFARGDSMGQGKASEST